MILEEWQMNLIAIRPNENPLPFENVYEFVKNEQKITGYDFKNTMDSIVDILECQDVNYGILILVDRFVVFTQISLELNAVLVKLATGINFKGQISDSSSLLSQINNHLGRKKTE